MLLGKFLHATEHKGAEMIQDIGQQNELLRIEERGIHIIEKLSALNCNSHASNLVFFIPELGHLLVKSFQLLSEVFSADKSTMSSGCCGCALSTLLF